MMDKNTAWKIQEITESLNSLLQYKNLNYGDAVMNPVRIFSALEPDQIAALHLDEKISRIINSNTLRKNDLVDCMGYLVLLCASKDWLSFEEFKD